MSDTLPEITRKFAMLYYTFLFSSVLKINTFFYPTFLDEIRKRNFMLQMNGLVTSSSKYSSRSLLVQNILVGHF